MTTQLGFTPEIHETLNYARYQHPVPLVQRRREVRWLKSQGLPQAQIAQRAGVSENPGRDYWRLYDEGGLEKLKAGHLYRPESALPAHYPSLEAYCRAHPPASLKAAQSEMETLTGSKRRETQGRECLKKNSIGGAAAAGCSQPKPIRRNRRPTFSTRANPG